LLWAIFEFFVVSKNIRVGEMEWLPAEGLVTFTEIIVGEEQCMKHNLAKLQVYHRPVPGISRTSLDASIHSAEHGLELVGDRGLVYVEHRGSLWGV
jgi:hypothetical protein